MATFLAKKKVFAIVYYESTQSLNLLCLLKPAMGHQHHKLFAYSEGSFDLAR